jgi:hypothetical protein
VPEKYCIPSELEYLYMIITLAKYYSLTPSEAGNLYEIDYWHLKCFSEHENKLNEYLLNKNLHQHI